MPDGELKPKKNEIFRALIDFIFTFENKKGEILGQWITFLDDFSLSPQEFYTVVEKEITRREIPNVSISREEFGEGGLLSDQRIYLRLFRERLAIYTCAAPFGTGYFFSCRTVYVPALVRLWHILVVLVVLTAFGSVLLSQLGLLFTGIAMGSLLFAVAAVLSNAATSAVADVDTFLLKIPVIATIYQDWFRADTYWRLDTRTVYMQRLPALINELAEEMYGEKGAKLVSQYERPPIYRRLYKPNSLGAQEASQI